VTALTRAELLRLRTVRSPRWIALLGLVVVALVAVSNLRSDAVWAPGELAATLRGLALTGVLIPAVFAASSVGAAFQRGEVAAIYLSHPLRASAAAAQAIVYAGIGLVFAAVAAGIVVTVGLAVAGASELADGDAWQIVGGAAAGGAAMGAAGALLGTATRHPTIAAGALVALNIVEALLGAGGMGPYLPFGLLGSLMGAGDGAPPAPSLALLVLYLAAFALAVRAWALPRDLT
jgi:hypothetical protein